MGYATVAGTMKTELNWLHSLHLLLEKMGDVQNNSQKHDDISKKNKNQLHNSVQIMNVREAM